MMHFMLITQWHTYIHCHRKVDNTLHLIITHLVILVAPFRCRDSCGVGCFSTSARARATRFTNEES